MQITEKSMGNLESEDFSLVIDLVLFEVPSSSGEGDN